MKNRWSIIIASMVFISLCMSCNSDLLDLKPKNAYSEVDVFDDVNLLENYVFNVYTAIHHSMDSQNAFTDGYTDNAYNRQDEGTFRKWFQGGLSALDGENITRGTWSNNYTNIRTVNLFFEKTKSTSIDAAALAKLSGEMYFLRAFLYYDLLKWYGGVPIVTKVYELSDTDFDLKRNSIDEVVAQIVKDCDAAIAALPTLPDQKTGRASKEAAMALKGRVLLFAASPLFNPSNTNSVAKWTTARDANKAVMDLSGTTVKLVDNAGEYGNLFRGTETKEIIFARYFTQLNQQAGWGGWGINIWLSGGGFGGWSNSTPTQDLIDNYELVTTGKIPTEPGSGYDPQNPYVNRDPRFYEAILYQGSESFDFTKNSLRPVDFSFNALNFTDVATSGFDSPISKYSNGSANMSLTGYSFRKYIDEGSPAGGEGDKVNNNPYIFFRLTEAFYNYAEAEIELGNEATAKTAINTIRAKRGMPNITETGAALKDRFRRERRIEFVLEDLRIFDIRRWMIGPETIGKPAKGVIVVNTDLSDPTKKTVDYHYTDFSSRSVTVDPLRTWNDKLYWLPIPPTEIQKSHDKLIQNPGYN